MKWSCLLPFACAGMVFMPAGLFAAEPANATVTSPPVYVPDLSHAGDPLPDGVLEWNSLMQTTNAAADQDSVRFDFSFTNVATQMNVASFTNTTAIVDLVAKTNINEVTNFTPVSVTILDVHASCGCTQPETPPLPWVVPPGGTGEFSATVNLEGRTGTMIKSITVKTDKGFKELYMRITVLPPVLPTLTAVQRAHDLEIAKADRQAVFKGDCIKCHVEPAEGKYGKPLYDAICGICHDVKDRASVVPDLHNLKVQTNTQFWQTWIAHGKPGTLMPAFSSAEGGPLTDMQIATVASYLNMAIPSQPASATTKAPAN